MSLNHYFRNCIVVILAILLPLFSYTEGTKQWMPVGMTAGQEMSLGLFNTPDGNDRLGTTGCSADERINIRVSSNFANEVIYIGMNKFETDASFFRVMDPNGTQVYPASVGTLQAVLGDGPGLTGEGYIGSLTEARNGPEEVFGAGGFDAISITPTMAGDYYIEFNGANSTSYTSGNKHQISYFDVTVANTNGLPEGLGNHTAIDGRLNAFQWSLNNLTDGSGFNDVDAEFFLYQSDDSLVLSVQWDQVKAGGWNIAFTRDGVQSTGDYFTDRQSQPYSNVGKGSVVGEFPIFVSPPDTVEYPSASDLPELTFLEYDRCSGSTCFLYNISKGGQVEILIDLNENGTFDPNTSDRLLVDNQPAGTHCLAWDDLDGLGDLVVAGQAQAVIKYQAGIFHMPLGDVEANANGFDRELIRPLTFLTAADSGRIYYDHTEAGGAFGAADYDFEGVTSNGNIWSPDDGNQLYLNTWFSFAELRDTLIVTFDDCDDDGDGLSDVLDIDDDNDGIPDIVEAYKGDHDDDGTPDYEDPDYCADVFDGLNGWDCADGLPDPSDDLDGDGIRNALDPDFPGCGSTLSGACAGYDADLDGIPDYRDLDSDNDGISDLLEVGGVDTDGDGIVDDLTDTDGDGLADDYDNDDTDGPDGSAPCAGQPGCLQGVSTNPLLDTDNNGVTDNERDTDGDGLADFIDLDADNDGIPDVVEAGGTDTDGDGFADGYADIDGDGFNDEVDGEICTDSTAIGTSTYLAGPSNSVDDGGNATGQPDGQVADLYTNGDLIVLDFGVDLPVGTQYVIHWKRKDYGSAGTADMVVEESLSPGAGYTTHSVTPQTDEMNSIVTQVLTTENPVRYIRLGLLTGSGDDFEIDAVKWYYNEEQCVVGTPIFVSGTDTDNDGAPNSYPDGDADGDGILDFLDLDADDDGIPDVVESGGTDENGDGRADNYVDSDSDGFNDVVDGDVGNNGIAENTVNAQLITGVDTDSDGVPNSIVTDDLDDDGVLNHLDLDADGDGILDVIEAGGTDADSDGIEDSFADADNDGFNDNVDGDTDNSLAAGDDSDGGQQANATTLTGSDSDNDGAPNTFPNDDFDGDDRYNFLDIDADNDGIVDNTEGQGTSTYIAPDGADDDGDGIDNAYDADDANFGGSGSSFTLSDIDAADDPDSPDYLDTNSDNDFYTDAVEGHDTDGDGVADAGSPANTGFSAGTIDVDGDGLYDGWDNNTSSTDATNGSLQGTSHPNLSNTATTERDWREIADKDNDGIADEIDIDKDNDGILDKDECLSTGTYNINGGNGGSTTNFNQDDVTYAYVDFNSLDNSASITINGTDLNANNGLQLQENDFGAGQVLLEFESDGAVFDQPWLPNNNNLPRLRVFIDQNGQVNLLGSRSTGATTLEPVVPRDGSSFNTIPWVGGSNTFTVVNLDGAGIDAIDGTAWLVSECDTDGDGNPDYCDLDSDNDGIADIIEAGGVDTNGDGLVDNATDDNADGWADIFDTNEGGTPLPDGDQDGDGFENRIDLDADNDGIADIIEAGGVDANGDGYGDTSTDTDADGWFNTFDSDNGGIVLLIPDSDGDGFENYLDLDSDSDGITDNVEGQTTADFLAPLGSDGDNDGWDDRYDSDDGGTAITLSNKDGTGDPDYLDDDSEDDGFPDWQEGFDDDEDGDALIDLKDRADAFETAEGNPLYYVNTDDADNDDIPDWLEDDDTDGTPNFLDPDNGLYQDTDNDGIVDLYDSDNGGLASNTPDLDGDGEYDFRDVDNQVSLPIELVSFTARKIGIEALLDWSTESEVNNDFFEVQRSIDGKSFTTIGKVKGAGNSNQLLNYQFYDRKPFSGLNYYRLKQIDFDGGFSFSAVQALDFEDAIGFNLYPNPSHGGSLLLELENPLAGEYELQLMSAEGKLVKAILFNVEGETIYYEQEILGSIKISKGYYFLVLRKPNGKLETIRHLVK
ncbi:MAG: hypothetical protein RIC95_06340 [Vicingaceae bacterium]